MKPQTPSSRALMPFILVLISMLSMTPALAAPNQPPTACFTVAPASGTVGTVFNVDAGCSTDDKTQSAKLKVRWDWENDGIWDTALTTTKTAAHSYPTEGAKTIKLQVQDQAGLTGTTTRTVTVQPTTSESFVYTPAGEVDVDVSPTDPQNLAVSAPSGSWSGTTVPYPAFYSTDGGQTWARSVGEGPIRGGDPGIEFDADGRVILMTLDDTVCDSPPQGIQMGISTDQGRTFNRSYAMDTSTLFLFPDGASRHVCTGFVPEPPCTNGFDALMFDYPKLGVDKGPSSPFRNNLYVMTRALSFDQDGNGTCDGGENVFIRSTDGGATWNSAQVLKNMGAAALISAMGVAPDGTLYLADATSAGTYCGSGVGIAFRKSVNGGASFLEPTCAYNSAGDLRPNRVWTSGDPTGSSRVLVVFDAQVAGLGNSLHVFVIRSSDGGASWSAPTRVDDVLSDDVVDHYRPSLSVSSNGRLDVIWFDYRNSSPKQAVQNAQPADVYYSYSVDGGATWSPNLRLSTVTAGGLFGGFNDFLTVTSHGNKAYAGYSLSPSGASSYEALVSTIVFH